MKHRLIYFFFILSFLSACFAEQDNELLVPTCHDGIQNQDEMEVDCGGRCISCDLYIPVVAPCESSLVDNTYTWGNVDYSLSTDDVDCYNETDHFEILIHKNSDEIKIYLPSKPTGNKIYYTDGYFSDGDDAYVQISRGSLIFGSSAGAIYVHVADGIITAEFCDVLMENQYVADSHLKGRIICQ